MKGNICNQTDQKTKREFENTYKNTAKIYQRIKFRNK